MTARCHSESVPSAALRSRWKPRAEIQPRLRSHQKTQNLRAPSSKSLAMPAFVSIRMKIRLELGGALKNTIAIAAGVCAGLGLAHNSVAALITRGLAEMTRLVIACGGKAETMAGLAGLGDLVLTCTGGLSRNRSVGVELGRGRKLPEILAEMHGAVAEGIFTTTAAVGLARAHRVEMPITEQMHAILHEGKTPHDAIHELMARSGKSETLR